MDGLEDWMIDDHHEDYYSECVVGHTVDGTEVYSYAKMVKQVMKEAQMTEIDAMEFLDRTLNTKGVILMDL